MTHGKLVDQRDLINQSTNLVSVLRGKVKKNLVDVAAKNAGQMFNSIKRGHEEDAIIQAYRTALDKPVDYDIIPMKKRNS